MLKGVNIDAGMNYGGERNASRLNRGHLEEECRLTKQLGCNAVRLVGSYDEKLLTYTRYFLKKGFVVLVSPRFINSTQQATARRVISLAKKLPKGCVLVVGNELSLDIKGFIRGEEYEQRAASLMKTKDFAVISKNVDEFLDVLVARLRKIYAGKIMYAAAEWEDIDHQRFDVCGVNLYWAKWNKETYLHQLQSFIDTELPVMITEVGTCPYKGASERGGAAYNVVDYERKLLKRELKEDEQEQIRYLKKLLPLYRRKGVAGVFIFNLLDRRLTRGDGRKNLAIGSFSIVDTLPCGTLSPNSSYHFLAQYWQHY